MKKKVLKVQNLKYIIPVISLFILLGIFLNFYLLTHKTNKKTSNLANENSVGIKNNLDKEKDITNDVSKSNETLVNSDNSKDIQENVQKDDIDSAEANNSKNDVKSNKNIANKKYKDGTYIGKSKLDKPMVKVSVTIKDDKMISIKIIDDIENPEYSEIAFPEIPQSIIEAQSTNVDAATGATQTSNRIKEAVKNALNKAKLKK